MPEGYASNVYQTGKQHCVGVGLTYMFGQAQQRKWRKVGNVDEADRLGSGGGQMGK